MAWAVEFQRTAQKQIRKLDRETQARILEYFRNRVLAAEHPRKLGKALTGDRGELWRSLIVRLIAWAIVSVSHGPDVSFSFCLLLWNKCRVIRITSFW